MMAAILNLSLYVFLARTLTLEKLGIFNIHLTLFLFISSTVIGAVERIVEREWVSRDVNSPDDLEASMFLIIMGGFRWFLFSWTSVILVTYAISDVLQWDIVCWLFAASMCVMVIRVENIIRNASQKHVEFAIYRVLDPALRLLCVATLYFGLAQFTPKAAAIGFFVAVALVAGFMLQARLKRFKQLLHRGDIFSSQPFQRVLSIGPIFRSNLAFWTLLILLQPLLEKSVSIEDAGIYGTLFQAGFLPIQFVAATLIVAITPYVYRHFDSGGQIRRDWGKTCLIVLIGLVGIFTLQFIPIDRLLVWVLGLKFDGHGLNFIMFLCGGFLSATLTWCQTIALTHKLNRQVEISSLAGAAVAAVICLISFSGGHFTVSTAVLVVCLMFAVSLALLIFNLANKTT